jgi:hypothetical protein
MLQNRVAAAIVLAIVTACAAPGRQPASYGSRHTHRFEQPPEKAAACFARNAEEHSSALVSEVRAGQAYVQVIVRVKNGVTYATADFQRAGSGAVATIALNVTTSGRSNDLVDALTEGC